MYNWIEKSGETLVSISNCCNADCKCEENRKWNNRGELVCVGTYYVCQKCGLSCEISWEDRSNTYIFRNMSFISPYGVPLNEGWNLELESHEIGQLMMGN